MTDINQSLARRDNQFAEMKGMMEEIRLRFLKIHHQTVGKDKILHHYQGVTRKIMKKNMKMLVHSLVEARKIPHIPPFASCSGDSKQQ